MRMSTTDPEDSEMYVLMHWIYVAIVLLVQAVSFRDVWRYFVPCFVKYYMFWPKVVEKLPP